MSRDDLPASGDEGRSAEEASQGVRIAPGADLQGRDLSGRDLSRANLRGANLEQAELGGANLAGACLEGAVLREAVLVEANLEGALLFKADLTKAVLVDANLREAVLVEATLDGATLAGADLRGARLMKASLKGVTLLGNELALADVTGATLPEEILEFNSLKQVEETSKNTRKLLFAMVLGCVYSWLTIATTTDARLLTNTSSSPLPIIGTEIPIAWFYWAAPFVLVSLSVYLHSYLQFLWEALASLPARFPDGKRLDQRAYPWLLNSLVRRHFLLLKDERPLMTKLQEMVVISLAWGVVPGTLFGFWIRYLPRHDWNGTVLHVGFLVASLAAALVFYRSAARTLRGDRYQPFRWRVLWRDRRGYQYAAVALGGVLLLLLSYGAIEGVRSESVKLLDARTWVPRAMAWIGCEPFANLAEVELSPRPVDYWSIDDEERRRASVKGALLKDGKLAFANARGAFLENADLRGADLTGAVLSDAFLTGANLTGAYLTGSDLTTDS